MRKINENELRLKESVTKASEKSYMRTYVTSRYDKAIVLYEYAMEQ